MTDIKTRDKALSDIPDSEEDDIWELKPIKWKIKIADKAKNSKKNQPTKSVISSEGTKKKQTKTSSKKCSLSGRSSASKENMNKKLTPKCKKSCNPIVTPRHKGHCPNCQMPFSILRITSPNGHVGECLDSMACHSNECPDGEKCNSTIESHYKQYCHSHLAQIRAGLVNDKSDCANETATVTTDKGARSKSQKNKRPAIKKDKLIVKLPFGHPVNFNVANVDGKPQSPETPVEIAKRKLCFSAAKPEELNTMEMEDLKNVAVKDEVMSDDQTDVDQAKRKLFHVSSPPATCSAIYNTNLIPQIILTDIRKEIADSQDEDSDQDIFDTQASTVAGSENDCDPVKNDAPLESKDVVQSGNLSENDSGDDEFSDAEDDDWLLKSEEMQNTTDSEGSQYTILNDVPTHQTGISLSRPKESSNHLAIPSSPNSRRRKSPKNGKKILSGQLSIAQFFQPKNVRPTASNSSSNSNLINHAQESDQPDLKKKRWTLPSVDKEPAIPPPVPKTGNNTSGGWQNRKCPFYKRIPGTGFTVDAFSYGYIPDCTSYFLSHFHYDHYQGLRKSFNRPLYCSKITKNLVEKKIKVSSNFLHPLDLNVKHVIEGVEVTLIEANHCPGAVLFLFTLPDGRVFLHTGDFRADPKMEAHPALQNLRVNQLFLDTTYCDPAYSFPPQQDVINFAVRLAVDFLHENPNALICVGSYTIGKERIFLAIAEAINSKICVLREKKHILDCLEDPIIDKRVTLQGSEAKLHVLPMNKLRFHELKDYLEKFKTRFDQVLAFEPTGWTHSKKSIGLDNLRPKVCKDGITIYGVPYSEHSSYTEMKRFTQFVRPEKIIPTVNVGNPAQRKKMQELFHSWMKPSASSPRLKQAGLHTFLT